jgi:hypothetical protein
MFLLFLPACRQAGVVQKSIHEKIFQTDQLTETRILLKTQKAFLFVN